MIKKSFFKIILGMFFLFQPMIVYLTSYVPGDCDDKAVHYYSAAYWSANSEKKKEFNNLIKNYMTLHNNDAGNERNNFRIKSTWNYPLANTAISFFSKNNPHFSESVKIGLLTVNLLAIIVLVLISSATKFGFWQVILLINLIAFYSLKINFLVPEVPRNMHPFITYVPRGGLALLVVAPLLAYSDRKKWLILTSLGLMFFWHAGMALMITVLLILAMIMNPALVFFLRVKSQDFYFRLFTTGAILLFLIRTLSLFVKYFAANKNLNLFVRSPFVLEIPSRLSGISYVVLIVSLLSGLRLLVKYGRGRLFEFKGIMTKVNAEIFIIGTLIFLALNHYSNYLWVLKKQSGFFLPQCTDSQIIKLPEQIKDLKLSDEPTFFLSLAKFLQ